MAASTTSRASTSFVCQVCRHRLPRAPFHRAFSSTALRPADSPSQGNDGALAGLGALSSSINRRKGFNNAAGTTANPNSYLSILDQEAVDTDTLLGEPFSHNLNAAYDKKPHRLHVLATKHNTHLTFVQPPRPASQTASSGISRTSASAAEQKKMIDVLLSLSTGNLNFRKAGRGSYDAAYQLTAYVLKQIKEKGMLADVNKLEVVLRGFGAGREAVTKALLGAEGVDVRRRISAVVDATRLKLGGPRSKKPRRLG
ncbi:hypothetical protein B0A50_02968 [Salinomyces thailandicus]|uniref:Mitochondrial ribosomal protein subunit S18 n=1 Tax=Salinomyces thailandicus TaxID=706561 RepID=A0A4U0U156_9PEZI|nr:hypothetical protein B0A50_02968 [Salinomyces thailandica]